ncbi:MAG: hypothetical protein ACP5UH_03220 [Candidatus Micrarchaeia archaeon]
MQKISKELGQDSKNHNPLNHIIAMKYIAKAQSKAQSAMEYLMTYGWAILVVSIVLAALFQLGIFNSSSFVSTACIPQSGFLCSNPVLTTSGTLSVSFGSAFPQINIIGTGCSTSSSMPSTYVGLNSTVGAGQITTLYFKCPFPGGINKPFSGTLWINYTQNGIDYYIMFARVIVVSTTYGSWPIFYVAASPQSNLGCPPYSWPSSPSLGGYPPSSYGYWEALGSGNSYGFDFYYVSNANGGGCQNPGLFPSNMGPFPTSSLLTGYELALANTTLHVPVSTTYTFTINSDNGEEIYYKPVNSNTWSSVYGGSEWTLCGTSSPVSVTLSPGLYNISILQYNCGGPGAEGIYVTD